MCREGVLLVPAAGVEPATFRSGGERSNPLSYAGTFGATEDNTPLRSVKKDEPRTKTIQEITRPFGFASRVSFHSHRASEKSALDNLTTVSRLQRIWLTCFAPEEQHVYSIWLGDELALHRSAMYKHT